MREILLYTLAGEATVWFPSLVAANTKMENNLIAKKEAEDYTIHNIHQTKANQWLRKILWANVDRTFS